MALFFCIRSAVSLSRQLFGSIFDICFFYWIYFLFFKECLKKLHRKKLNLKVFTNYSLDNSIALRMQYTPMLLLQNCGRSSCLNKNFCNFSVGAWKAWLCFFAENGFLNPNSNWLLLLQFWSYGIVFLLHSSTIHL